MATETVNRQINIFIESGEAQKVYDKLIAKEKELNKQLAETSDPKRTKQLYAELDKLKDPIDRATKKLKGELSPSFKELQGTVNTLGNRLKRMAVEDADYSKVLKQYNQANAALLQQKTNLGALKEAHENTFGSIFKRTAEYFGAFEIISRATNAVKDFFKGTIEEADQAQESIDGLKVALENVGRGDLLKPLLDEADKFAEKYKRLDNDDVTAVFTKLVNYGKLTRTQIGEITDVIINYAAKQKISLTDATDVFTKALEGSAKGLKTYGINLTEAKTVTERYGIIVDQLGQKVHGAEAAFEETNKGFREKLVQGFRDAQEKIGNFFYEVLKWRKSANELFDEAKQKNDAVQQSLSPLISRYDELKGKTKLNKDEQTELHGIIQKIVEIMPSAATEINKYGVALDINKQKVIDFQIENKKLLAEKEFRAVEENEKRILETWRQISTLSANMNKGVVEVTDEMGRKFTRAFTNDEQKANLSKLRTLQEQFLTDTETRVQKYGKTLNTQTQAFVNSLKAQFGAIKSVETKQAGKEAVIGGGDPNATTGNKPDNTNDKIIEDQKKLDQALLKASHEYEGLVESDYMKELQAAFDKFENLKQMAHGNKEELKKIEVGFNKAVASINEKFAKQALEAEQKLAEDKKKIREKELQDQLKRGFEFVDRLQKEVEVGAAKTNRTRNELESLEIAKSLGKKKHDLINKQLDEQEQMEVAAAIKAGESVELVHMKFNQKRKDEDARYLEDRLNTYLNFAQQLAGILDIEDQAKTNRENAELARDQKLNDKKKANLQKQLDKGIISRKEYDRKVEQLDKQAEAKEKAIALRQFKRQQREQVVNAFINGAQASLKTLAQFGAPIPPNFLGMAAMALTIGTTIAQIAAIKSQEPPQFARGGKLGGRSHADGGNAVVDGSGRKIAEVEHDEGIINKRSMRDKGVYSVTGTPSQIASRINGIGGGVQWESGATLAPTWRTAKAARMNFAGIQKKFAQGGKFASPSSSVETTQNNEVLAGLVDTVNNLNAILSNGIVAYASLRQFNTQQSRIDAIKKDATFR